MWYDRVASNQGGRPSFQQTLPIRPREAQASETLRGMFHTTWYQETKERERNETHFIPYPFYPTGVQNPIRQRSQDKRATNQPKSSAFTFRPPGSKHTVHRFSASSAICIFSPRARPYFVARCIVQWATSRRSGTRALASTTRPTTTLES